MTVLTLNGISVLKLKPFNLKVEKNIICISGASGSGKSLLLRAIADLIVHEGEAILDGEKCSEVNPVLWRKRVGYLPAESSWWKDKVGEHFSEQPPRYLSNLNLPAECMAWDIARCSTGEKQRLAIVRLLEQKPKILLLDEPTASLDPESVELVEQLIKDYMSEFNAAVIWVSHDKQQTSRLADREYKIVKDEIIEVTA